MIATNALCRRSLFLAVLLCPVAFANAQAPTQPLTQIRLKAHYTISMTGVSVGQIAWLVTISGERYTTLANGKASGVLSVLVNGEGSVDARGNIVDGRPVAKFFTSKISDDEGNSELRMNFDDGVVKDLIDQPPASTKDRVPVTEAHRRGVADPLSAMLIAAGDDPFSADHCNQVLPIFDGRRRYDLALSFKRIDKVALERSYSGRVLVCGVVLQPMAGYRADSALVKYVGGRRDMELWFAPIIGSPVIAPILVKMPTLLGTLEIEADQFDVTRQ